ncbi:thermonuclease family protein [Mesorhizobium sp. IMUNJ 23232]|uniref:thermonuclease family protein n=1 Tax=Mesorhizobium sp. IMUNJ 23232 TaxID=3376064 RepID=UPI0037888614
MSRFLRATLGGVRRSTSRGLFRRAFDLFLAVVILGLLALLAARLDRVETLRPAGVAIVNDGDTITIAGEKIRLRGIDAPEYSQTCLRAGIKYACGREAREALRKLIGAKPVACAGWQRDRYGRLLGDCKAGSTDLNRSLVEQGWAVAFGGFEAEELAAQRAGRGLWAGEFERPRQWRETHGSMVEDDHGRLGTLWGWITGIFGLGGA